MEDCTPTGNERWIDEEWQYHCAVPIPDKIVSGTGPGGIVGVAMGISYYWTREYEREFLCCPGAQQITFWVRGNYWIYRHDTGEPMGIPVVNLTAGVPLPGPLGFLADALGAGFPIASWWANVAAADGLKPEGPPATVTRTDLPPKLAPTPRAECGKYVIVPGAEPERMEWHEFFGPVPPAGSTGDTPIPPPPPPRPITTCCTGLDWMQRRPQVQELDKRYWREGGHWLLNLDVTVSHRCDLAERPRFSFALVSGSSRIDLTGMNPPLVQARWDPQPRTFRFKAERQQMPIPPAGPNPWFGLEFSAKSTCGGTLVYTLKLAP